MHGSKASGGKLTMSGGNFLIGMQSNADFIMIETSGRNK